MGWLIFSPLYIGISLLFSKFFCTPVVLWYSLMRPQTFYKFLTRLLRIYNLSLAYSAESNSILSRWPLVNTQGIFLWKFSSFRYLFFKISLFNILNEISAKIFILIQFLGSVWNKGLSAQISSLPSWIKGCLAKKKSTFLTKQPWHLMWVLFFINLFKRWK